MGYPPTRRRKANKTVASKGGLSTVTVGISAFNLTTGTPNVPEIMSGLKVLQHFANLTHTRGATTASNVRVSGSTDWTNPGNAQGSNNGTFSSIAGQVTTTVDSYLRFQFTYNATGRELLNISSAKLRFYVRQQGTALDNGDLKLQSVVDGIVTTHQTITGNLDALSTPREFDVPFNDWNKSIEARVRFTSDVGENLITADCDAVVLVIQADRTEVL